MVSAEVKIQRLFHDPAFMDFLRNIKKERTGIVMCIQNDPWLWSHNVDWNEISKEDQEWLKEKHPDLATDMIFRFPRHDKKEEPPQFESEGK